MLKIYAEVDIKFIFIFFYEILYLQVCHTCQHNHTCSEKAHELETIDDHDAYMPVL